MKKDLVKGDEGDFEIIEGNTPYRLHYKLWKSRLSIRDDNGNLVSIDKRMGKIVIHRRRNVYWHREPKG